jgi:hypothetical protein
MEKRGAENARAGQSWGQQRHRTAAGAGKDKAENGFFHIELLWSMDVEPFSCILK